MTIIAGYALGHRSPGVLELAAAIASARQEDLLIVTVVPPRWNIPSMARQVDGEYAQWAAQEGENALAEASATLHRIGSAAPAAYRRVDHRSAASALLAVAEETRASVVVVGSSEDGRRSHVELGSTSDRLVHSAQTPIAIAPRGYRGPGDRFTSITCAVAGRDEDAALITSAKALAHEANVPLRLVMFAVRLDTMYPPEVGLHAEDDVARAAREQAEALFDGLRASGVIEADVETVVGLGRGWRAAVDSIPWDDSSLLLIGSNRRGAMSHVFLGSAATKIIRHSRIPVVVLPA